jgi:hypothetical protein
MQRIVGLGFLFLSACTFTTATRTGGSPSSPSSPSSPPPVVATAEPTGNVPTQTERPGGPLTLDKQTCDVANDHCLREGTWFLEIERAGYPAIAMVYQADGRWWDWGSGTEVTGGRAHRTRPARPDELEVGDTVLFFSSRDYVPRSEHDIYQHWRLGTIHSIDLENRTFEHGTGSIDMPIDLVRVIVETR